MNPVAAIIRFLRLPFVRVGGYFKRPIPPPPPRARPRRSARSAVVWCAAVFVALHVLAVVMLDDLWPRLRDPEYGIRVEHLKARITENPGRPVVLVIGSSRVSMGLRPAAWEQTRPDVPGHPDPLLFNMSLVGSGPLIELMCLRRVYADGFRPDAVVFEYWPPFLREDGPFYEPDRIDHNRLFPYDRPFVDEYFSKAEETERKMRADRSNPLYHSRHRLVAQVCPRWQPWDKRMEMAWANLDPWGWMPGLDEYPPIPAQRKIRLEHCEKIYRGQFFGYSIDPLANRALREAVALARANGAKVAFTYLPEASEFRSWMPAEVNRIGRENLDRLCRELDVPLIDARLWMGDDYLVDGFHLSRQGAAEFTRRFGPAVAATLPDLGRP